MRRLQDDGDGTMNSTHDATGAECIHTTLKDEEVHPNKRGLDAGTGENCKAIVLTFEDLIRAIDNFSDGNRLTWHVDGQTYTGFIWEYPFVIAVKFYPFHWPFWTESQDLRVCRHPNIVRLLGTTTWEGMYVMISEGTPRGTLDSLLCDEPTRNISWDSRLDIALDLATGLAYLHDGLSKGVSLIHRHLTPSRIFLSGLTAKIGGFTSSTLLTDKDGGACSQDVKSFGVILLELITRTVLTIQLGSK